MFILKAKGGIQIDKIAGIYQLINKANNKVFINSTTNIQTAKENLINKLKNNEHKNQRLQDAWNKYGENFFEFSIIEKVPDIDTLSERKKHWINEFRSNEIEYGYNLELYKRPWEEIRDNLLKNSNWNVVESVWSVLKKIISQLDYEIEYADERNEKLKIILKNYDNWFVDYVSSPAYILKQHKNKTSFLNEKDISTKGLEYIADYLIFPKYKNELEMNYVIHKKSRIKKDRKREICVGDIYDLNKIKKNNYKFCEIKVNDEDLEKYPELKEVQIVIDYLSEKLGYGNKNKKEIREKLIKEIGISKVRKYEKLLGELKKEQKIMKEKLVGYIYFKRVTKGTSKITFENDTGYFNEVGDYVEVSNNKIDFKNKNHILQLLHHYSELKQFCWDKPDSEMYLILDELERLIQLANFEEYIKDILILRIDGYFYYEIREMLEKKYGICISEKEISNIFNDKIPKIIVDTYLKDRENWIYTYKVKGEYKKCSRCGEIKLTKYFTKDEKRKDGFFPYCKSCNK